ncbi:unnamed protein product [Gongylonema pulchrum]|uniref:Kunitz/Bovine pancreatic trypsin inhibitor domain protein n=1 Tax=Gongylonema pulchrum TaxID=637853 RepID=A0A183CYT7_9BILA|nr:unnamed protein product [Gongylonema pulchrum]
MQHAYKVFAPAKLASKVMGTTAQKSNNSATNELKEVQRWCSLPCGAKLSSKEELLHGNPDVDECLLRPNVCHRHAKCRNVNGSYICQCKAGYAGNGYNCTTNSKACMDSFDRQYNEQCGTENWREHYYFDHDSSRCTLFWYDGCPGTSMNIFSNLETCEALCEITNVLSRAGQFCFGSNSVSAQSDNKKKL